MDTSDIIDEVSAPLLGLPVYLAGSLAAEEAYSKINAHDDVDLFCSTEQVLFIAVQRLLSAGYTFKERFDRVWERWLRYGFKRWHTNSIKLISPAGNEVNVVYKLVDGHPTTSLGQVLESFDFGLLGVGYDLETKTKRDMREYLFPGLDPMGPLPFMPNKQQGWKHGFISQYNGLREPGRYAKYARYGYDMSAVKTDLIAGFWIAADYHSLSDKEDKAALGKIYEVTANLIEDDSFDKLFDASKKILFMDSLDLIMAELE